MAILEIINEFGFRIIEALTILLFSMFVLERKNFLKESKIKSLIFITFYTIFSYWATTYIPKGLHTVVHMLVLVLIISFILRSHFYSVSVAIAINGIIIVIIEIVVLSIVMAITQTNMTTFINTPEVKFYGLFFSRGIHLGLISALYLKNIKFFRFDILKKEYSSVTFVFFNISIMVPIIIASVNFVPGKNNSSIYTILILLIFLLTIILNMIDLKEREKMLKIKNKFEVQEDYVKNMETVINIIRREKHDFANHLNTILALCTLNKPDSLYKIKEYIINLSDSLGSSYHFYNTGNDYIDGLLAVKSNYAHENLITMDVNFDTPLDRINIDSSDLISILGNIVDNAFEAIIGSTEMTERKIVIRSYIDEGKYKISILNSGPEIPEQDLPKIFANGYSTKTEGKKDRGFGLYITQQLVKRNSGSINLYSKGNKTEFILEFSANRVITTNTNKGLEISPSP
ncbi:MAG: hypothetical protein K0R31_511 [Clostridiales bacterium]|nr:hypothetical protein [Clostridiales bacterium]